MGLLHGKAHAKAIISALEHLRRLLQTQYGFRLKSFECDNEITEIKSSVKHFAESHGSEDGALGAIHTITERWRRTLRGYGQTEGARHGPRSTSSLRSLERDHAISCLPAQQNAKIPVSLEDPIRATALVCDQQGWSGKGAPATPAGAPKSVWLQSICFDQRCT